MHFSWEILWEIFKICKSSAGNAVVNSAGNLVGNGWGNDAVFSLNTLLRTIYCLQTIHEPACVILTLFQFLTMGTWNEVPYEWCMLQLMDLTLYIIVFQEPTYEC